MIFAARALTLAAAICLLRPLQAAVPEFADATPDRESVRSESNTATPKQPAPNLTPHSPSVTPLLRKVNLTSATMIPPFYCERVPPDRETEVDVPPFDWGVANDRGAAVTQSFSVVLLDGRSKTTSLAREVVPSIPQSGTRVFRNWPGRPTRVHVLKITAAHPQFGSEYASTPGCYIPTARIGLVELDPQPLIIRVDAEGKVSERVETDNELAK